MKRIFRKLFNKEYREAFVDDNVTLGIPIQIKYLREDRGLTQASLAKKMQTTQAAISRLEDPDYGRLTVKSLLKLSTVFDVGLVVKFVPFSKFMEEYKNKSPAGLRVKSFNEEVQELEAKYQKIKIDNYIDIFPEFLRTYSISVLESNNNFDFSQDSLPKIFIEPMEVTKCLN
jgi:transcriptional regulator with XRE-family HTH domain